MATKPRIVLGDVTFAGSDIREATVTEEFNPLCITMPASSLDVLLYSEDADFSILNPAGNYASLKYATPMLAYIEVDSKEVFIGKYYLNEWENVSNNLIRLYCIDQLGFLATIEYKGGVWVSPTPVGELIEGLLDAVDIGYDLDPTLAEIEVTGWLPICSCRFALQQMLIASGGFAICARQTGGFKIGTVRSLGAVTKGIRSGVAAAGQTRVWQKRWRPSQWSGVVIAGNVPLTEQGGDMTVTMRPQITGVEVTAHDKTLGDKEIVLFDGHLEIGSFEITFNQPVHTLAVTGATIASSGVNHAVLSVAAAGDVKLTGLDYVDTRTVYGVYLDPPITPDNFIKIDEDALITSTNAQDVAQLVFDYYQNRYTQSATLYKPTVKIGDQVYIETLYDQQIFGIIEKMIVNLAGGYRVKTDVVGVVYEEEE